MTAPVCSKLDAVLARLASDTLARAAGARFTRVNDGRRISSVLELAPQVKLAAAAEYERFRRWIRGVSAVLDRRGASPSARRIELLAADLEPLVRCTRRDAAEIMEMRWRKSFADEVESITAAISALLNQHASAFDLIQIAPPRAYAAVDIPISPNGADAFRLLPSDASVLEYGHRLYQALLSSAAQDVLDVAPGTAVRYQLLLDDAGPLASERWELLHDGREFVALRRGTSLARAVQLKAAPPPVAEFTLPLRVLVTVSSPQGMENLDTGSERAALEAALGTLVVLGLVELHFAPDGRLETLRRLLRAAADTSRPFHVWHFIGHGTHNPSTGTSALLMEDGARHVHRVGGDELGLLLRSYGPLSTVILNCCHGGRGIASSHTAAPARAMVAAGVPTVVAMQSTIRDDAANMFAEELYGALCDGRSIDEAVGEGRRRLYLSPGKERTEWGTPVLFVGADSSTAAHRSRKAQG
ncbi:MAG: hypothetical protein QOI58_1666 [Thermoanaerobaculia bacterium]|jgi:hypothetical protein|nr:hypothetical protein [Thermoanaerobaculia bacterium]